MKEKCYVIEVKRLKKDVIEVAGKLLDIQRMLEKQTVDKIDCMFVAAWQLSLPSVDAYLKELSTGVSPDDPKVEHSKAMNEKIDDYFMFEQEGSLLESIAKDSDMRDILPVNDLSSSRDINELTSDVEHLMKQTFGDGSNY